MGKTERITVTVAPPAERQVTLSMSESDANTLRQLAFWNITIPEATGVAAEGLLAALYDVLGVALAKGK